MIRLKSYIHRIKESILDGFCQWCEVLIVAAIPIFFYDSHIADVLQANENIKPNGYEFLFHYAVRNGDFAVCVFLMVMVVKFFYEIHDKKLLNVGIHYHDHSMLYYRLCNKILGYKKCCLVRVPVDKQFCLVMNDCFDEYDDGGESSYKINENENIKEEVLCTNDYNKVINLCIEDTYPIEDKYIPKELRNNTTIKISRYEKQYHGIRYDSEKLADKVAYVIGNLPNGEYTVNVMATTNVRNTIRIAQAVFKTGGRGKVEHLNVYKQLDGNKNKWEFSSPTKVF